MYKIQESGLDQKWASVLDNDKYSPIKDKHKRDVLTTVLENQEKAFAESREAISMLQEAAPANAVGTYGDTGGVAKWDSVLIGMLRRSMPQLIAYDVCDVQPMTMPAQLIFAMKSRYGTQNGTEALFNEANAAFSGTNLVQYGTNPSSPEAVLTSGGSSVTLSATGGSASVTLTGVPYKSGANVSLKGVTIFDSNGVAVGRVLTHTAGGTAVTLEANAPASASGAVYAYSYSTGMTTPEGEALGTSGSPAFHEMAFSIEKTTATVVTRALKTEYSLELVQDLRAVHGLDAENVLSNMLSTELLSEMNREVLRTIYTTAQWGARAGSTNTAGTFDLDLDSNGRWSVEKFKGLMFQIERDANAIGHLIRRGRGNFIICSADVASALAMTGKLDYNPALQNNLNVDDSNATFAGILNNKYKVYIDPYSANLNAADQFYVVGYKGEQFNSGLIYSPYTPLQMVRAVDPGSFQPKLGFKSRYALTANPYASGTGQIITSGVGPANSNVYYSKVKVQNLM
jgi:hypothetical protein